MSRARHTLLSIALVASFAVPLAAQGHSAAFNFLKAVRERDGAKVQEIVSDPSSTAINARDHGTGEGALHILVKERNLQWLAFLLTRGARPDLQTTDGTTPLGLAAHLGWTEGASQLLARRAKVDLANSRGETPLMLAVQARHLPLADRLAMVRLLISKGADPRRQENITGYSALDFARQEGRTPQIIEALEAKPATPARAAVGPNP